MNPGLAWLRSRTPLLGRWICLCYQTRDDVDALRAFFVTSHEYSTAERGARLAPGQRPIAVLRQLLHLKRTYLTTQASEHERRTHHALSTTRHVLPCSVVHQRELQQSAEYKSQTNTDPHINCLNNTVNNDGKQQ